MRRLTPALLSAAAAALAVTAIGCSSAPRAAQPGAQTQLTMRGPNGVENAAPALKALSAEGAAEAMQRHLQALSTIGRVELVRGNSAKLLIDGPSTFAAMRRAIEGARSSVLLESYIFEDEGVAAQMGELLAKRARDGLRVALIRDAIGSFGADNAFFDQLAASGVAVCVFNSLKPGEGKADMSVTQRDHRKLLVVDEQAAFTGGINISSVYSSGSGPLRRGGSGGSGGSGASGGDGKDPLKSGWRDTQVELHGPIVNSLAQTFAHTWHGQGCEGALDLSKLPRAREAGPRVVTVLATDPREADNRIYQSLLAAINASKRSVRLTMAYFAPGREMAQALEDAARRGVSVELVLPGRSDFSLVMHAGRAYYDELLDAGVHLYEMDHAVLHAKTALIDGVWSSVGSSNMDWRSFVGNNELNVVVLGDDFGDGMQAMFDRDRATSKEITPAIWRERGIKQRFQEGVGRLFERWL